MFFSFNWFSFYCQITGQRFSVRRSVRTSKMYSNNPTRSLISATLPVRPNTSKPFPSTFLCFLSFPGRLILIVFVSFQIVFLGPSSSSALYSHLFALHSKRREKNSNIISRHEYGKNVLNIMYTVYAYNRTDPNYKWGLI